MSKSKRSLKSKSLAPRLQGSQLKAILIVCIVFAIVAGVWSISEFWPGPSLEAEGQVVGHGCADRNNQSGSLENCHILYSIVVFTDAHGQQHVFHRPEDDLAGTVIVRYRFITLPGNITLGVSVDQDDPRWVRGLTGAILSVICLILAGLAVLDSRPRKSKDTRRRKEITER